MKAIHLLLVVAGLTLAGCIQTGGPQGFPGMLNGSDDTECRHAGSLDTGYVVNCNRRNDTRSHEREILR